MHLPSELVNQLAPHHGWADWFYVSGATLIAAAVAIGAAIVAYKAATRQIRSNARQLSEQIGANAENVRRQIVANQQNVNVQMEAEDKRRKRADRVNVVTEAYGLAHELLVWATKDGRRGTVEAKQERQALELKMLTVAAKLDLVGMTNARETLWAYWQKADQRATSPGSGVNLPVAYGDTLTALKKAVDG